MNPAVIILSSLTATSLLLCVALAVAWASFGRERHAAIWSIAFGLSAATWTSGLVNVLVPDADTPLTLLSIIASMCSFAMIALGFRHRVGLPDRIGIVAMAGGATILPAAWAVLFTSNVGIARALVCSFDAAMLIVSALSLRGGRRDDVRATGRAAFWMLAPFAGYDLLLAGLALCTSSKAQLSYQIYHVLLLTGLPTGLFGVGLFAMFLLAADLAEAMRRLAGSDPLTGILNRRGFEQAAQPLVAQSRRQGRPLAVAIADLDRFKTINDRFGHGVGDAVLQCFAEHVAGTIRQGDLFGRLGGEEFVLVMPNTDGRRAIEAVERVRAGLSTAIEALVPQAGISASFGIALVDRRNDALVDALHRADLALYQSKMNGRDRITLADAPADEAWESRKAA